MPERALRIDQGIGIAEAFAVECNAAEQRIIHRLLV